VCRRKLFFPEYKDAETLYSLFNFEKKNLNVAKIVFRQFDVMLMLNFNTRGMGVNY
jgi:hypothetical protein